MVASMANRPPYASKSVTIRGLFQAVPPPVPSYRSGGIQHLALTAGSMFHRPGCRRALLKLLFTDHQ